MKRLLTAENYNKGFLVDDEVIAGVTLMDAETESSGARVYSAYVSHYLTGETYAYQEFDKLEPALDFLAGIDRAWAYEAVGCSAKTGAKKSGCGTGGCGSGGCSSGSCG